MQAATRLIVNADDYGLTPGTSAGIRRAHRDGIVTVTTAMMIFDNLEDDIRMAREETPDLALGVHLVASEYAPLRPPATVRSLLGSDEKFVDGKLYYSDTLPDILERIDTTELRDEWRAQIERFLATGATIDHIDAHHHVAYFSEKVFGVLAELAGEYRVPVRAVITPLFSSPEGEWQPVDGPLFGWLYKELPRFDLRYPDAFLSGFYDETATVEVLLEHIERLPHGTFELMCHPAEVDDALIACTTYALPRANEVAALTDPRVRQAIEARGIELVSFAALR